MVLDQPVDIIWTGWDIAPYQGFDQLKGEYFGTITDRKHYGDYWLNETRNNKQQVFHYALFADKRAWQSCPNMASGVAEILGNDMLLTMGCLTAGVGSTGQQAGTFMHELGHNLNLRHGGVDDTNHKPNYFSVMNYDRQFIDDFPDIKLDYSSEDLNDIVEGTHDENTVFPNYQDDEQVVIFRCPDGTVNTSFNPDMQIDWDCDGVIPESVSVNEDLNDDAVSMQTLKSFDDWKNTDLKFMLNPGTFQDGASAHPRESAGVNNPPDKQTAILNHNPAYNVVFNNVTEPSLHDLTELRIQKLLFLSSMINELDDRMYGSFNSQEFSPEATQEKNASFSSETIHNQKQMYIKTIQDSMSQKDISLDQDNLVRPFLLWKMDNAINKINHHDIVAAKSIIQSVDLILSKTLPAEKYAEFKPLTMNLLVSYDSSLDFKPTEGHQKHIPETEPIVDPVVVKDMRDKAISPTCAVGETRVGDVCVGAAPEESVWWTWLIIGIVISLLIITIIKKQKK